MRVLLFLIVFLSSCSFSNDVIYLKDLDKYPNSKTNEWSKSSTVQINDVLLINVTSSVPEAAILFNKFNADVVNNSIEMLQLQGYLVDENYTINFPVIGMISVKNKSLNDLEKHITSELLLKDLLKDASVSIRFLNYKFTILGEVNVPGNYTFVDNNLNLLQAIGHAGGLNKFSKKKKISIIREINGVRKTSEVNLTSTTLFSNPYFYIRNNDVIIVHPNFKGVKSSGFIGTAEIITSLSSLVLTISLLILNR